MVPGTPQFNIFNSLDLDQLRSLLNQALDHSCILLSPYPNWPISFNNLKNNLGSMTQEPYGNQWKKIQQQMEPMACQLGPSTVFAKSVNSWAPHVRNVRNVEEPGRSVLRSNDFLQILGRFHTGTRFLTPSVGISCEFSLPSILYDWLIGGPTTCKSSQIWPAVNGASFGFWGMKVMKVMKQRKYVTPTTIHCLRMQRKVFLGSK